MARYSFPVYNKAPTPRYVVLWDLHWHVLGCHRLDAVADLSGAMAEAIQQLAVDGWQTEATPKYGFAFIRRRTKTRLRMLTPRDPHATTAQSFSPFRPEVR